MFAGSSWQAACTRCPRSPGRPRSRPDDAPRPGNLYGSTKAWAEAVGAWADVCGFVVANGTSANTWCRAELDSTRRGIPVARLSPAWPREHGTARLRWRVTEALRRVSR